MQYFIVWLPVDVSYEFLCAIQTSHTHICMLHILYVYTCIIQICMYAIHWLPDRLSNVECLLMGDGIAVSCHVYPPMP